MDFAQNIFEGRVGRVKEQLPDYPWVETTLRRAASVVESAAGWWYRAAFDDIQAFCMFVGHPRSGHSLFGALLDAHPEMVIAHELHALKYVKRGVTRKGLFFRILLRAHWFKEQGAEWEGYGYAVPSQHKGEFDTLKVIGDKKGSGSSRLLRQDPGLLGELRRTVRVPVRVLRVIRHPLDNISTLARRGDAELRGGGDIDAAIETYFRRCETAKAIRERVATEAGIDWLECAHEDFVRDPKESLRRIRDFLGVFCAEDYLEDCAEVVFEEPRRSREEVTYEPRHLERIRQKMESFPSLDRYVLK